MINSWIIRLVVLVLLESYGTSQVATYCDFNQAHGYCRDKTISMIGDFNVAVTIGIHQSSDGRVCDRPVSISGFQAAIALEWITSILNEGMPGNDSYVPDVKFGNYTIIQSSYSSMPFINAEYFNYWKFNKNG